MANFQYAAPEQRTPGRTITSQADIYALGLILNEMFAGTVPHGTQYRLIASVAEEFAFLDPVVARMLAQTPSERPSTIEELKASIPRYQPEAVSLQRISKLDGTVIRADQIDEPLAEEPPRLVDATWDRGQLTLILDRPVTPAGVRALQNMGSVSSVMSLPPQVFSFNGKQATVSAAEHQVQLAIDHFKSWLLMATRTLKQQLEADTRKRMAQQQEALRREREEEEARLRVTRNIRI